MLLPLLTFIVKTVLYLSFKDVKFLATLGSVEVEVKEVKTINLSYEIY
jgi:hypothetical protein